MTDLSAGRGCLITVEGIEGAGKTSTIEFIAASLSLKDLKVVVTREPGGTELGETLREVLLAPRKEGIEPETEALLMFAARAEHIARVIEPALGEGAWVICDRFTDATYAYQGGGRGMPLSRIAELEHWVQGALRPDLTLLLDVEPETGLRRAAGTHGNPDRFEAETLAFFERAREVYLRRAALEPARFAVIDAQQPLKDVKAAILEALERLKIDDDGEQA